MENNEIFVLSVPIRKATNVDLKYSELMPNGTKEWRVNWQMMFFWKESETKFSIHCLERKVYETQTHKIKEMLDTGKMYVLKDYTFPTEK